MIGWQESVNLLLSWQIDRLQRVRQHVPVNADHNGKFGALGDPKSLDGGIDGFLVVSAIELNPAGVPHRHRSCWSFHVETGAPTARLAQVRTIGMRKPPMLYSTSV